MKFGLIVTEDHPAKGGEQGVADLLLPRFIENDAEVNEWVPIFAVSRPLPCLDVLKTFDGLVITGSHHCVNEDAEWIRNLEATLCTLRKYATSNGHKFPRIFGICFAHQLIAKAFGGKVDRVKHTRFIWGPEKVHLSDGLTRQPYFRLSFGEDRSSFTIMQSHEDAVVELPPDVTVAGWSQSCPYEVLMYGKHFLTVQGHPESSPQRIVSHALPRIMQKGLLPQKKISEAVNNLSTIDVNQLMQFILNFIKGK